jgi:hypothetical protein
VKVTILVHFKPVKGETIVTQIPADLFKKLLTVLKVVHNLLVDPATQSSNLGLTRRLGDQLWDDLSHSIVTHCLSNSIPKHSSELESYQEVIGCVADFESQLIELGMEQYLLPLITICILSCICLFTCWGICCVFYTYVGVCTHFNGNSVFFSLVF